MSSPKIRTLFTGAACAVAAACTLHGSVDAQPLPATGPRPAASNQGTGTRGAVPGAVPAITPAIAPASSAALTGDAAIPQQLTVEDAVRIGLRRNPQITGGAAGVASAGANYRSIAAFPALNLGVTHVAGSSAAPTLNGTTSDTYFDVGDVLDTSGQRRFQAAGARAQFHAASYQLQETKLTVAQQIRDAYWSLAAARAQTLAGLESVQEVQHVNQLTRLQQTAGASPVVDVVRSGIDVANAQQAYITAQGAEQVALAGLNGLLVRPPAAPVQLADTFSEDMAENPRSAASTDAILGADLVSLPDLIRTADANRPAVKAAIAQVEAARYAVEQAKAARLPDVSVDYERSVADPIQSIVLGVHVPVLDFGSIRNSVTAAQQTLIQARAQEQQAELQVAQQVSQAFTDYAQARQLAASYRSNIVTPSVSLLSMAQLGYRQGATGILPVIDAETTLRSARTGYINSILALYKAQDEVEAAVGVGVSSVTVTANAGPVR
ncbi:MAG: TolC family protein [Chloroflexi bacterium]|nr:TolC family protein [Chloroflexota bacterium]